jgi:hypothetical protein
VSKRGTLPKRVDQTLFFPSISSDLAPGLSEPVRAFYFWASRNPHHRYVYRVTFNSSHKPPGLVEASTDSHYLVAAMFFGPIKAAQDAVPSGCPTLPS